MTKHATINFGKIDYYNKGRKVNLVSVELELRDTEKGVEFSATGAIWNTRKTDWICGGQCLDTIAEYIDTPLFNEILRFWRLYHLNAMHAGTEKQEYFLKGYSSALCIKSLDYETAKKVLQANGLYNDNGNKYGCAWYYHEIPETDLKRINEIIDKYNERGLKLTAKEYELLIEAEDGHQSHFRCDTLEYAILQFEAVIRAAEVINSDARVSIRLIVVENHIVRTLAQTFI